jgi:SAM-dependent methyltransferase
MTDSHVRQAYAARASEYTAILGSIDDMHVLDRNRVELWAQQISGRIIDVGCGPGHWTDFIHQLGADISGIDLVPEFVESARRRFPDVSFQVNSLRALHEADETLDGVLAWYSLIHLTPDELPPVLAEIARVLSPQGHLLLGFFDGDPGEPFDHAVTTAYYVAVDHMSSLLNGAGFDVTDVEKRQDPGSRPHAAICAILR